MSENRFALLIGCSVYDDRKLTPLPSATKDIEELGRILGTSGIGDFQVSALPDRPAHEAALAIQDFLAERQPEDLVLVQFSCHGLKDADGKLYFAARNTKTDRLLATAIPATTVNDLLTGCRCRRKLLLLDCCYGGAFLRGIVPRASRRVGVFDRFPEGRGLVVITSSDALQYAYEGELVKGKATSSAFTGLVVKGIETGAADKNGDGLIGVTELYQYVSERMANERPEQRPEINNFRLQGEIYVARSRNISLQLPLTWTDAQRGGEKIVAVNGKPETVTIPAGAKDGQQERYIGKGLPTEGGIQPGDLVITFNVAPRRPADAARARLKAVLSGVGAALVLSAVIFLVATTRFVWIPHEIGNHWPPGESGSVTFQDMPDGRSLFTGLFWGIPYARRWDTKTGALLKSIKGQEFSLGPNGKFLLVADESEKDIYALDLRTYEKHVTPYPYEGDGSLTDVQFGETGDVLIDIQDRNESADSFNRVATIKLWSLSENEEISKISGLKIGSSVSFDLLESHDRLIAKSRLQNRLVPSLWNTKASAFMGYMTKHDDQEPGYTVDSKHALVAVIEKLSDNESAVELWNLDSGRFINERVVPRAPVSNSTRHHGSFEGGGVQFSEDASLLLIGGAFTEPYPVRILHTADLSPYAGITITGSGGWELRAGEQKFMAWSEGASDTRLWHIGDSSAALFRGTPLGTVRQIWVNAQGKHAVIVRDNGAAELWDIAALARRNLAVREGVQFVFPLVDDDNLFGVVSMDGVVQAYKLSDGKAVLTFPAGSLGDAFEIAYNADCQWTLVWAQDGRVLRYIRMLSVLGKTYSLGGSCRARSYSPKAPAL